ncbi:MAG: tetratricopeptide repeat protein [Kiritimatiellaeota bacterium]|nr:tetratricopeptide repeat protein [Kiritimatiellota bacterium]
MEYEDLIRQGELSSALSELQQAIRKKPADSSLRVLFFQLLVVMGDWDRASTQLAVAGDMSGELKLLSSLYSQAILCEKVRLEVFSGKRTPIIFGEPEEWMASMIQALAMAADGNHSAAAELSQKALENAPTTSGSLDGTKFDWIMDMDSRLGPLLEVVMNGAYYWISFSNVKKMIITEPSHLVDFVWVSVALTLANGTAMSGLVPVRYSGTLESNDHNLLMSRKTDWREPIPGYYNGLGQRMFATNVSETALLDVRELELD